MHMCIKPEKRKTEHQKEKKNKEKRTRKWKGNIKYSNKLRNYANYNLGKLFQVNFILLDQANPKTFTSALLTMPKPLTVWITTNYGKFFKRWGYQTTLPAS